MELPFEQIGGLLLSFGVFAMVMLSPRWPFCYVMEGKKHLLIGLLSLIMFLGAGSCLSYIL